MSKKSTQWFQKAFQLKGSVLPAIFPRVLLAGIFGELIALLHYQKLPVYHAVLSAVVPPLALVLGLLLVFRTNTAYDRFWEGRKCWGSMVNSIRSLARQMIVGIEEVEPTDRQKKEQAIRLLTAFAFTTKLHLRQETVNHEVEPYVTSKQYELLKQANNPPLEVMLWLSDYWQDQSLKNRLDTYQLTAMNQLLSIITDALGGCERILKTPMPLAYAIHLKQLLLMYCLALPFQLVKDLQWGTGPVIILVSLAVFGIEEIGIEIENPFGHDANDLPLDTICSNVNKNIEDLLAISQHHLGSRNA